MSNMWWSGLGFLFLTLTCLEVSANCVPNSIRLYNSSTSGNLGLLQICNSSRNWSAVCDRGWGCTHSVVACKQLGFINPTRIEYKVQFGPTDYFSFGPYSSCQSSYATLFSCYSSSSNRFRYCSPFINTIGLKCASLNLCTNGKVRLVNDQSPSSIQGRVEYCYEGEWSAFSNQFSSYFSPAVAYAFCYKLGYTQNS
uniref:SRCR domain-containing protein n=1 Tax=Amphimedon queenslandica TaxID=400682 RepID=A0A1X7SHQ5_AMPQE